MESDSSTAYESIEGGMKMAGPIIKLEGVNKEYGKGKNTVAAMKDVNLEISKGDFVAVLGPSGCGKSTLLHVMSGLEAPSFPIAPAIGRSRRIETPTPRSWVAVSLRLVRIGRTFCTHGKGRSAHGPVFLDPRLRATQLV